jgi:hemolysin activation/secretion protein
LDPPGISRLPLRRAIRGKRRCSAVGLLVLLSALTGAAGAAVAPAAAPAEVPSSADELLVGRFVVEDGDPRLAADTERLLAPLRGRTVTLAAIQAAAAKIQQRYVDRGHFMVLVSAAAQPLTAGGEFHLRVIRRAIKHVDVEGVPEPYRARVLAYVTPILGRSQLSRARFQRAVLLAGAPPGLTLKSTLEAGPTDDAVTLVLTGEYRAFTSVVSFDNAMPAIVGRNSATLISAYNPAARFVDQLSVALATAADTDGLGSRSPRRLVEAAVRTPVGISGAELDWRYTWSAIKPTSLTNAADAADGLLDTDSTYKRAALRATYPLVKVRSTSVLATLGFDATSLTQSANPFAASLFDDQTRVLRVGLALDQVVDPSTSATLGVDWSRGLHGLGSRSAAEATAASPLSQLGADDAFTKWEAHGSVHRDLPAKFAADLQVRGQYVGAHPLLLAEKFTLGGPADLSAYDFANFSGDRGWVARAELQQTQKWDHGKAADLAQGYLFAARGEVVNLETSALVPRVELGAAVGIGLRGSFGQSGAAVGPVEVSGEIARQLNPESTPGPSHWRVNFSVSMHF